MRMSMKNRLRFCFFCLSGLLILTSCNALSNKKQLLNPEKPITVTVWNYYNGSVKIKFDELVREFNETEGTQKGIVVEAQSYGDVNELADAVFASVNDEIGSLPMPDIFAAYPDNVFRINKVKKLVDLQDYFTEEELGEIREEFLSEGYFGDKKELKILPIAKSSEILYLNKTYWDKFEKETGAKIEDLATWEGLVKTAKIYYDHYGKAFFGVDANANFMLVSAKQLGNEFYTYLDETASLNLSEISAYRIWENYYIPYINGYFTKTGRFSSDDAKTGAIIAYTGSTAGASYFPVEVAEGEASVPIDVITLPYPYYEGGKKYVVQQGAGMCISESDAVHEYAAALFLKWFIDPKQNVRFAVSTGYLPVKTEALNSDLIFAEMDSNNIANEAVKNSIITIMDMFETYTLYGNKPFMGSYEIRNILENHLFKRVNNDLEIINYQVSKGESCQDAIAKLSTKQQFHEWYEEFAAEVRKELD